MLRKDNIGVIVSPVDRGDQTAQTDKLLQLRIEENAQCSGNNIELVGSYTSSNPWQVESIH